ncbi:hypothetical protein BDN72DRAFT_883445 [Pluteus cervinus]|uniref:Uncharacterized protein n=1 Tax=Pluteus cervinus TaxID=181527 RepID=A0ACD3A555_9AGAR|nr:hypothetical protein BDN72DRAFT_883445 [Pluteus cervinus]
MSETPLLEYDPEEYPLELRMQPLPEPPPPFWRTPKGIGCIVVFAIAVVGAIVGGVVPSAVKKSKTGGGPGVAAVTWQSNGQHIRVYFQQDDGFVYEGAWDQGTGWSPNRAQLFQAKTGTPLAAVVFAPAQVQIHIYYVDRSNVLQEYVYNNGWGKGATLPSPNLSPITSLTAITWNESMSQQTRVYYQRQDNTLQEVVYSSTNGWSPGQSLGNLAYPGTGLGAVATSYNNVSFHIYWQANDLSLHEYIWSNTWSNNILQWSPVPASGISAVTWPDSSGNPFIRVYFENPAGTIQEVGYNGTSGWVLDPSALTDNLVSLRAPISAALWVNGDDIEIRAYAKSNSSSTHTEFTYSGSWTSDNLSF